MLIISRAAVKSNVGLRRRTIIATDCSPNYGAPIGERAWAMVDSSAGSAPARSRLPDTIEHAFGAEKNDDESEKHNAGTNREQIALHVAKDVAVVSLRNSQMDAISLRSNETDHPKWLRKTRDR